MSQSLTIPEPSPTKKVVKHIQLFEEAILLMYMWICILYGLNLIRELIHCNTRRLQAVSLFLENL